MRGNALVWIIETFLFLLIELLQQWQSTANTSQSFDEEHVSGARFYAVRVASDDQTLDGSRLVSEDTSLSVTSLRPGTTYKFYVSATGDEGQESEKSNAISDTTSELPDAFTSSWVIERMLLVMWL